MPIYEYECSECGRFEVIQKASDENLKSCASGRSQNSDGKGCPGTVHKLISQSAFHLKGSGWYKTDYASPPPTTSATKSSTSETKPETAPKEVTPSSTETTSSSEKKEGCGTSCGCH